jgi:hypothetical protein
MAQNMWRQIPVEAGCVECILEGSASCIGRKRICRVVAAHEQPGQRRSLLSPVRAQLDTAQRSAIESWAKREGVEVCAWYEEEVSGGASLEKRPVLLQAISALGEHGAALLVVQRLDRFSRDPFSAAMAEIELVKFGARMVTTDSAGDGQDPASRPCATWDLRQRGSNGP